MDVLLETSMLEATLFQYWGSFTLTILSRTEAEGSAML